MSIILDIWNANEGILLTLAFFLAIGTLVQVAEHWKARRFQPLDLRANLTDHER